LGQVRGLDRRVHPGCGAGQGPAAGILGDHLVRLRTARNSSPGCLEGMCQPPV
jgi:hypothetical protein